MLQLYILQNNTSMQMQLTHFELFWNVRNPENIFICLSLFVSKVCDLTIPTYICKIFRNVKTQRRVAFCDCRFGLASVSKVEDNFAAKVQLRPYFCFWIRIIKRRRRMVVVVVIVVSDYTPKWTPLLLILLQSLPGTS